MEKSKTNTSAVKQYLLMALAILLTCLLLFYIDKNTKQVSDLLKPGNIVALVIYFAPTFIISAILFNVFVKKHDYTKSLVRSLAIGIPVGLTIVILLLAWRMGRLG